MADQTPEKILGWFNDEDVVLCPKCFAKQHQHHDVNWTPIKKEEGEENLDTCDECQSRL